MQNNENLENLGVDPNDAPEGFIATRSIYKFSCFGCYFDGQDFCYTDRCVPSMCKDNKFVIFIKKQDTKATLSYPCGSLGEEIEL